MVNDPYFKHMLYKIALIGGALIVIYGLLWLFATIGLIPNLVPVMFPQLLLIMIGLFIIYKVINRKNSY